MPEAAAIYQAEVDVSPSSIGLRNLRLANIKILYWRLQQWQNVLNSLKKPC